MKRNTRIALVVLLIGLGALGAWFYDWVLGETEQASEPISAAALQPEPASQSAAPAFAPQVYQIAQEGSEARFIIYEELRGTPTDVVGATDQVAGQLAIELNRMETARLGEIRVNARSLVTDSDRRNRAIGNRILNTDTHEYITFTPERIAGLSGAAGPGDTLQFQAHGNLTIRDVTRPVTFVVTARVVSPEIIAGEASAKLSRADFGLVVPNLNFIANVADEVRLEFSGEFRAAPGVQN